MSFSFTFQNKLGTGRLLEEGLGRWSWDLDMSLLCGEDPYLGIVRDADRVGTTYFARPPL